MDADYRLAVNFIDDEVSLLRGEFKDMRVLLSNTGTKPISEIWIVSDVGDEIWLSGPQDDHDRGRSNASPCTTRLTIKRCFGKRNRAFYKFFGFQSCLSRSGSCDRGIITPAGR